MCCVIGENLDQNGENISKVQNLLKLTKEKLERDGSPNYSTNIFWKEFEKNVKVALEQSISDMGLKHWAIQLIAGRKFPDIVAEINGKKSYGVEVKTISSKNNNWKVLGGSIMESTRIPEVDRIYAFCAKEESDGSLKIKYGRYEDCIEDVKVTHSPRYLLNMELLEKENTNKRLFCKIGKTYDEICDMVYKFDAFKSYMIESRKKANHNEDDSDLWWYSPNENDCDIEDDKLGRSLISGSIEHFNKLPSDEKKLLKIEMLLRFPDIVDGKYDEACLWLLQKKGIICPSFRDLYSAGGRATYNKVKVRKIIGNINHWKNQIATEIKMNSYPVDFQNWKKKILNNSKFKKEEKKYLREIFNKIDISVNHQ